MVVTCRLFAVVGIVLGGTVLPANSAAAEGAVETNASAVASAEVRVRPDVCVTTAAQPSCDVTMTLNWQAADVADYCIDSVELAKSSSGSDEIACWQQQRAGTAQEQRSIARSFEYQLVEPLPPGRQRKIRARTKVVVVAARSKDKRRNRRRRHVWSVL